MASRVKNEKRMAPRRQQASNIEFLVEGDLNEAATMNVSELGLQIETDQPLGFTVRFVVNGQPKVYRTHMVWAKRKANGKMTYGLDFDEPLIK